MSDFEHDQPEADEYVKAGIERSRAENRVLQTMLDGFNTIQISRDNEKTIFRIHNHCNLESYIRLTDTEIVQEYNSFSDNLKAYCHCLAVMNALNDRGLVERNGIVNRTLSEGGDSHSLEIDSELRLLLDLDDPVLTAKMVFFGYNYESINIMSRLGPRINTRNFSLKSLSFTLNEKGFDVALKLQEHNDQNIRFEQQLALNKQSIEASQSSAKSAESSRRIASRALWAAGFIAIGSIGNLLIHSKNFLIHFVNSLLNLGFTL